MKTTLLLILALALAGCAQRTANPWEHLGPPDGADTSVKVDADGNPNFGPR